MGRTLGLIAGSGRLPFEVLEAARARGLAVAVVAIEGYAAPEIEAAAPGELLWNPVGQLAAMIAFLKDRSVDEVILAGGVAKRNAVQDLGALRLDERALAVLAGIKERGDDALLRAVAAELESEGLPVVDSTRYLEGRLTCAGPLAGPVPEPATQADLALGLRVAKGLGSYDVGQSVVVKEGSVLAVEAVEGTDAAIRRGAELGGTGAVVVKASKPNQDLRFDVPVIGPGTIDLARSCGIVAIGLEEGRTLIVERERTLVRAEESRISVIGMRAEAP
jgi:DUF1009 family protein